MGKKDVTKSGTAKSAFCSGLALLCALGMIVNVWLFEPGSAVSHRKTRASTPSTASRLLASTQSFGFFDDIPDGEWKQRQRRARLHNHQVDPSDKNVAGVKVASLWYLENYYPLITCPNQQRVGIGGDGPKWVCDPLRLGKIEEKKTREKCLVYSVGCNGNYKFEDGLVDLLGAGTCEIHVFDVKPHFGRLDDNITTDIHFHGWGLKSSYNNGGKAFPRYSLLTLQETMKELGHEGRTIDIFKADCEGCTWTIPFMSNTVLLRMNESFSIEYSLIFVPFFVPLCCDLE
jgi:Methyltransferase domain